MLSIHPKQDSLTVPVDIKNRSLPPLPVTKRKLPALPQSKSVKIRSNKCTERERKVSPNIIITPPTHSIREIHNNKSLRNLFSNIQRKIGGNKKETKPTPPLPPSKWRPSLQYIIDDGELLNHLIAFMTKQYNEENILFLQCVNQLKNHINELLMFPLNIVKQDKIDVEIASIYNRFIANNAEKQINLSSDCFYKTMSMRQTFKELSLSQKASIFEPSWNEINSLIQLSILSGFYPSDEFQSVAHARKILDNNTPQIDVDDEYDSDDVEYGNVRSETPRIQLEFDCHSLTQWTENNKYMISSRALTPGSGIHQWSVEIVKTTQKRQEFGIVSVCNNRVKVNQFGVCDTASFGARSVYGYNSMRPTFYYASYNQDNVIRCSKDLSSLSIHQRNTWAVGDVVTVCVNMRKHCIKFYLNGQQVRKTISIDTDTTYYPIILYSGECEYKIIT